MIDIRVQQDDFSIETEYERCRALAGGGCGAIASFVGLVRDSVADDEVQGLHLEHYAGMTERSIQQIIERARNRWNLQGIVVVHRVGRLTAGEQIVLVVVASSHRLDAFAACEFLMDYLKTEAVFWKKEIRSEDEVWITSTKSDYRRRDGWENGDQSTE